MTRDQLLQKSLSLPDDSGVYVMKDSAGADIYVGKAKNLKRRVSSYFRPNVREVKTLALVENIVDFDYAVTASELEAFLLESRLIKDLQPKYNLMLKYNELYPYIEITLGEDFPRAMISRRKDNEDSRYFGPFVGVGDLRSALAQLQRIFQFRLCAKKLTPAIISSRRDRGCLNYHLDRCAGVCRGALDKETYRRRIAGLCRFLSGQKKDLLDELNAELRESVEKLQFENAAALRDLIAALENLNQYPLIDESLAPPSPTLDFSQASQKLAEVLRLDWTPRVIEGFDVANLQGGETVASLVSFIDGQANKNGYRRFRIKTVEGQDDFACLAETLTRRYHGSLAEKNPVPDIVLIDGGLGQIHAAESALAKIDVAPRVLLSLAKREELIYRSGESSPIKLAKRNPALRLLMQVRDEAHRFAQHYHHLLRKKAMFD